jgi:hypothetical protein
MRRRTRGILIGVGLVVVVAGSVYAVLLGRATARLQHAYTALEKDGRPTEAAGLIPPVVPDAQNALVLYEKAASLLKAQPFGSRTLLWHLGQLANSLRSDSPDPNDCAELNQWMQKDVLLRALAAIEQGTRRPACRVNRNYDTGVPAETEIAGDFWLLGRLLSAKAYLQAEAGAIDKAWSTTVTQLRFADSLRSDPLCDGQLCRAGLILRACSALQTLCDREPPGGETYREIEGILKDLDDVGPLLRALDGERLLVGERLFGLPRDELYQTVRQRVLGANDRTPEVLTRLAFRIMVFRPRLVAEHALYLDSLQKSTRLLQGPYVPAGSGLRQELHDLMMKPRLLTRDFTPYLDYLLNLHYRTTAQVHIARTGLALLEYRQTHGAFPPTVVPLGLEKLTDPYTREPLRYWAEGAGFVVYSVGEDLEDNGGTPRPPKGNANYDFVWRFPGPKGPGTAGDQQ